MSMFRVGQKVTLKAYVAWFCDEPSYDGSHDQCPQFGAVYTIRSIEEEADGTWLRLAEIANRETNDHEEATFDAAEFRPVVDISDLESIVAEVRRGKPRKIKDDQFDRNRVGA